MVISHHPEDYHPDHRYTSTLVQDASFMVTVPNCCPDVEALRHNPYFFYLMHARPSALTLTPHIAIAIDDVMEVKYDLLDAMESQIYEWLPWLEGTLDQVPSAPAARKAWLREVGTPRSPGRRMHIGTSSQDGTGRNRQGNAMETFEICPYGRQPSETSCAGCSVLSDPRA